MKKWLFIFFTVLLITDCFEVFSQKNAADSLKESLNAAKEDSNKVNLYIDLAKAFRGSDPGQSLIYSKQAFELANTIGYKKGIALGLKWIGLHYFDRGNFVESEEFWRKSLDAYEAMNDQEGVSNILNNLGSLYYNLGNNARALEYFLPALEAAEKTGDKLRIATTTQNIGLIYMSKPATYDQALEYLKKALVLAEELNDLDNISSCNTNIGEVYMSMDQDSLAIFHFMKAKQAAEPNSPNLPYVLNDIGKFYQQQSRNAEALKWFQDAYNKAKEQNNKLFMIESSLALGEIHRLEGHKPLALEYLKEAQNMAGEIRAASQLKQSYQGLANIFEDMRDYRNAFAYQQKYSRLADTLFNMRADSIQSNFEMGLKTKEIDLLKKDNDLQELELNRQRFAKNTLIAGLALVSIIIFILYRDYRNKIVTNKLLDNQKAEIENLLLNILPNEVAKELQRDGVATPHFYESASVMFTDFKNFTILADNMSPQEVVAELNACFIAFDAIVEKYGLEKIKTIGDAYMCAGGIPTPSPGHYFHMIEAAREIQQYILERNTERERKGLPAWELRIGIHVGPLVAGVVGKKKYAYDIWGSTVNIASRMESNGEPGEINISEATYLLVKDRYECKYRGKIYAKNVGEIDMYFLGKEIASEAGVTTLKEKSKV